MYLVLNAIKKDLMTFAMALLAILFYSSNDPLWMSLVFSALLELALALLYLLSVCISVVASIIIRLFRLRPPCFCNNRYHGSQSSNTPKKKQISERLLCKYHANKLSLLHRFITNGGLAPVYSLCEDCMLLNCSSTETNNAVNSNHIESPRANISVNINSCQVCLSKRQRNCAPAGCAENFVAEGERGTGLESEQESDPGNSNCSTRNQSHEPFKTCENSQSSRFKEEIREHASRNKFGKEAIEEALGQDSEEPFYEQSSHITSVQVLHISSGEIHSESSGAALSKNYAVDEQEASVPKESPLLDISAISMHPHCFDKKSSDSDHLERELVSNMQLTEVQFSGGQLPNGLSRKFVQAEGISKEDHVEVFAPPSVDVELQIQLQKSEAHAINELKEALEAEREAYSALCLELEEERNASAIAASETMAMISRLQEEKAVIQMELRQFKRMVEEKTAFDQEAIALLKEILCRREEEKFALEKEVELYRSRLLDHKFGKSRRQRLKQDEFEEQHGNGKLRLSTLPEHPILQRMERRNDEIIEAHVRQAFGEQYISSTLDHVHAKHSSLLDEGVKIKPLEDSRTWETENLTEWNLGKRHNEFLPSGGGKSLLAAFDTVGTKPRESSSPPGFGIPEVKDAFVYPEVNSLEEAPWAIDENLCKHDRILSPRIINEEDSLYKQSFMPHDEHAFETADGEHVEDPSIPIHSLELQQTVQPKAEKLPNMLLDATEASAQNFASLNTHGDAQEYSEETDATRSLYSQRENEHGQSSFNSIFHGENGFLLEPGSSDNIVLRDDFAHPGVEPMDENDNFKQGDAAICNYQQASVVKPLSFVKGEIGSKLYSLPFDLNASEKLHKEFPEEAQLFVRYSDLAEHASINSFENSSSLVGRHGEESGGNDMKSLEESLPLLHNSDERSRSHYILDEVSDGTPLREGLEAPGHQWWYGADREMRQSESGYGSSGRPTGYVDHKGDDGLYLDFCSDDELLQGTGGYDLRTASMIRRDNERTAVQEEVKHLTSRLQALENDRQSMKNIMQALRSENGGMHVLHDIGLQLKQLHGFEKEIESFQMTLDPGLSSAFTEDLKNESKKRRR